MKPHSLSHLSDHALLRDLASLMARDRQTTAELLAHIAEVDSRKLYLPAGHSSMYAYCVDELHLSEEAAFKRIHAARTAHRFRAIFPALADGRLHLSAVVLLAPHLTPRNADELLAAAAHKRKSEIERLIAERFPRPDVPTLIQAVSAASEPTALVSSPAVGSPAPDDQHAPGRVALPPPETLRPKVTPLAPQRFALQLTMSQELHDKLRYAQELLGHQISSRNEAEVFERALDLLIAKLGKQKFSATSHPGRRKASSGSGRRYVPAEIKRAV